MAALLLSVLAATAWWGVDAVRAGETVQVCGLLYSNHIFAPSSAYGIPTPSTCPMYSQPGVFGNGLALEPAYGATYTQGQGAIWQTEAPAGLEIVSFTIPTGYFFTGDVNSGTGGDWGGEFYWNGGSSLIYPSNNNNQAPIGGLIPPSSQFGMLIVCGRPTCSQFALVQADEIELGVQETIPPSLAAPAGLWPANGWVRGWWTVLAGGDSPSGVCVVSASLAGQPLPVATSPQDVSQWRQCFDPTLIDRVNTADYGQGAQSLTIAATDAAGLTTSNTKTIYIDNEQPTIALTGPTDAPSTAGTQYVTATAGAGPSGVAGISCSVDGGPSQWYATSTAQVPVSGIGVHQVRCVSENNATDGSGTHGTSSASTFQMKIGEPTVAALSFDRIVDKLRCHLAYRVIKVRGRWVRVHRGHGRHRHLVKVRTRGHTKLVKVRLCHPRTKLVLKPVWVRVRHGKRILLVKRRRWVRVVLLPHTVANSKRRVRHGHGATVNGWLGTYTGVALGGQPVDVLTAADNGRNNFHIAAVTTTNPDGSWSARLPKGPSRLVVAYYPGGATTETAQSTPIQLIVPARVELLRVYPRAVPWGGTIHLVGRLKGGYLPPGGALVRLRIGYGASYTTYGVEEHVTGNGRFTTTYTFGLGAASIRRSYWFQIASLPMGNYPYAPASSRRISVLVGGHPTVPPPPGHRRTRHRRRK